MRQIIYFSLLVISCTIIFSCKQEKNNADTYRLQRLDSLLITQPEVIFDSLKLIDPDNLNGYNNAYYNLLDIIAKDKNYFDFNSDSLINETVEQLSKHSKIKSRNYARALMYQGIVRYRMQITDSTAYLPLKNAASIFATIVPADLRNQYLCLYYVGKIHEKNRNYLLSKNYFRKSVEVAKLIQDTAYLYSGYSDIFWMNLNQSNMDEAKKYLDTISKFLLPYDEYQISFRNMQSVYFERTGQCEKSLYLEKQIMQLKSKHGYENGLLVNYYNIAKSYNKLNQLDSAIRYALLCIQSIRDTSNFVNHYYYLNTAEIAEQLNMWEHSSTAYKRAYETLNNNIDKDLNTKVLEIENKYNLAEVENKVLRLRNHTILLVGLLLVLLLILFALVMNQIKQKQIKYLVEERNRLLETEKRLLKEKHEVLISENLKNEQELLNKQLVLSFFQQVSMQNFEMKSFLYDLKANPYITDNKVICSKISKECENYNQKTKINNSNLLSDSKLMTLTGISKVDIEKLNKSERLILLLIAINVDNVGMAVLFNTSTDSIRNRKSQLKKKIEQNKICLNENLRNFI